jgi:hypothetical protein
MTADSSALWRNRTYVALAFAIVAVAALAEWGQGRVIICKCGYVKLWQGVVMSPENSQHLTDWYTFSHFIHGFLFYFFLWLIGRRWPVGLRFMLAVLVESSWEVFENSPIIIDRYRAVTMSLGYEGDSIINSMGDIVAMIIGFYGAMKLPVWLTISLAVAMELFVGYMIRDNLTLNIIMLIWPIESIRQWQAGA